MKIRMLVMRCIKMRQKLIISSDKADIKSMTGNLFKIVSENSGIRDSESNSFSEQKVKHLQRQSFTCNE